MKPVALVVLAGLLLPASALAQTESAPEPAPNPGEIRMYGVLDVGYAYESVAGVPITAAAFTLLAGIDLRSWGLELDFEAAPGRTDGGLATLAATLGVIGEAHVGRLRLGGGPRLGSLNVGRVTTSGSLEWVTYGVGVRVSYDVLQLDSNDRAFFVVAKAATDAIPGSSLDSVSAGVGVRF